MKFIHSVYYYLITTEIYLDTMQLIEEEKLALLSEKELAFLNNVRTSKTVGEWEYENGVWSYKDKVVYNEIINK